MTKAQVDWLFIAGLVVAMAGYVAFNLWGWL